MKHFATLMEFLRNRSQFLTEVEQGKKLGQKNLALLVASSVFFAIYGAIMGSFSGGLQVVAAAIKLPALYLLTMLICLPTLYFFEVVSGSKRTFSQYLALLLAAMSMISVMLFGFAPITLFFRISLNEYLFFALLNVIILAITGLVGVSFFYHNFKVLESFGEKEEKRPSHTKILRLWLVLYGFVGSQLGWTLRPFFGDPDRPFAIFRDIEGNIYFHLLKVIAEILHLS